MWTHGSSGSPKASWLLTTKYLTTPCDIPATILQDIFTRLNPWSGFKEWTCNSTTCLQSYLSSIEQRTIPKDGHPALLRGLQRISIFKTPLLLKHAILRSDSRKFYIVSMGYSSWSSLLTETIHIAPAQDRISQNAFLLQEPYSGDLSL